MMHIEQTQTIDLILYRSRKVHTNWTVKFVLNLVFSTFFRLTLVGPLFIHKIFDSTKFQVCIKLTVAKKIIGNKKGWQHHI